MTNMTRLESAVQFCCIEHNKDNWLCSLLKNRSDFKIMAMIANVSNAKLLSSVLSEMSLTSSLWPFTSWAGPLALTGHLVLPCGHKCTFFAVAVAPTATMAGSSRIHWGIILSCLTDLGTVVIELDPTWTWLTVQNMYPTHPELGFGSEGLGGPVKTSNLKQLDVKTENAVDSQI